MINRTFALLAALALSLFFSNPSFAEETTYTDGYDGFLLEEVPCRELPHPEANSYGISVPSGTPALIALEEGDWIMLKVFPEFNGEYWSFTSCWIERAMFNDEPVAPAPTEEVPTQVPTLEPTPTEQVPTAAPTYEPTVEPTAVPTETATEPASNGGSAEASTPIAESSSEEPSTTATPLAQNVQGMLTQNTRPTETPGSASLTITLLPHAGSGDGHEDATLAEFLVGLGKFIGICAFGFCIFVGVYVAFRAYLEHKDDKHYAQIVSRRR